MKVLWLCPIMLPEFADFYGERRNPKGGWITGSFLKIKNEIEIEICCPAKKCNSWNTNKINNTIVYTWKREDDLTNTFSEILLSSKPEVIQIWGTEKKMTLDMVNAAEKLGMLERVLVICQGFVSYCGRYHFFCHLPYEVINSESPAEYKYNISLRSQCESLIKRGNYEIEAIKKVKYAVGRTEWDEICTKQINSKIHYYKCYESLRNAFYENEWDYDNCEKHSIFLSQSHYPIKGLHLMLEAMPLILKEFPDAILYTTGHRPKVPETFVEKCSEMAYPSYIAKLIKKYKLEEHVEFLGVLSEKKMCERYLMSNVAVSTSSIENESNSVAEAMLLGMPIVSSNVGGIGDFIRHRSSGYLYQSDAPYLLAHYVCNIFRNIENAKQMGANAKLIAKEILDREVNKKKMLEIYNEVVHNA